MGASTADVGHDRIRDSFAAGALRGGILITIHRLSYGGADRVAMLLANGFAASGIPTGIVVLRSGGEGEQTLLNLLDPAVSLVCAGRPLRSRHLELVRGVRFIRRQTDCAAPAIVLASSSNMGLVTGLSRRTDRAGSPRYVMKLTNPVIRPTQRDPIRRVYRTRLYDFIFGHYEQVLILSDAERARLDQLYPHHGDRFVVVPNPYVSAEMFAPRPARAVKMRCILALARLMPQKRLDRLLRAFARLSHADSRLCIVGEGPERPGLERLVRSLGLTDRVEMPGFAPDVAPWLKRADLLALSSDYEGLPAAILEALAAGVPVITTDCFDEAHALLDHADQCAVVPRDDIGAFARAMDQTLSAAEPPSGLQSLAMPYEMGAAIAAHIGAIEGSCRTRSAAAFRP